MFASRVSPSNNGKLGSRFSSEWSNPFDSDDELDNKVSVKSSNRTSESRFVTPKANPFDSDDEMENKFSAKPLLRTPERKCGPPVVDDELDKKVRIKSSNRTPETKFVKPMANPFDSDDELEIKISNKPLRRTPEKKSAPPVVSNTSFDAVNQDTYSTSMTSSKYSIASTTRSKNKNRVFDAGEFENQSVQELESYAVSKAEETTETINGCLKIAEEMRESGVQTLSSLHEQGEKLTKSHHTVVNIENDLSRGEKLLGSLGGIFSRTWKPKKNQNISGPVFTRDDAPHLNGKHLEQKAKLGLNHPSKEISSSRAVTPEPATALQKIELEKEKQDDALTDLSNILGEMKMMAMEMGTELEWQTKAIDHYEDDVAEVNSRLRGANARGLHLLRK